MHMNTQVISAAVSHFTKKNCGIGRMLSAPLNRIYGPVEKRSHSHIQQPTFNPYLASLYQVLIFLISTKFKDRFIFRIFSKITISLTSYCNITRKPVFLTIDRLQTLSLNLNMLYSGIISENWQWVFTPISVFVCHQDYTKSSKLMSIKPPPPNLWRRLEHAVHLKLDIPSFSEPLLTTQWWHVQFYDHTMARKTLSPYELSIIQEIMHGCWAVGPWQRNALYWEMFLKMIEFGNMQLKGELTDCSHKVWKCLSSLESPNSNACIQYCTGST